MIVQPDNYIIGFRDRGRIIQGVLYCIVGLVCGMMEILLFRLNRDRHKDVIVHLMGYFGLIAFAVLLQGVFSIIEFEIRAFQTFWTDSSFLLFVGAGFCLECFVYEVFQKGVYEGNNPKWLLLFLIMTILTEILLLIRTFIEIPIYLLVLPVLIFVCSFFWAFIKLLTGAMALRKRMETPTEKKAFLLIGMHGILLFGVAIFAVLYSVTDIFEMRYLSAALATFAFFSLYKGITLPMKKAE
jgi:hypothetical protein